jgi:fucose permease
MVVGPLVMATGAFLFLPASKVVAFGLFLFCADHLPRALLVCSGG